MSYSKSEPPSCCPNSTASGELKLYQTFIFSIPIFFTFLLLLLFYLFYLRRRRVDWSSLRMRTTYPNNGEQANPRLSESGLKKEIREMLPIIVYKETFSVKDTLCSVCLGDYEADEKLQQIPVCKHTFHMECIDHWLSTHTTCPLCRLSLVPTVRSESSTPDPELDEAQANDTQTGEIFNSEDSNEHGRYVDNGNNNEERLWNEKRKTEECSGETGEGCSENVLDLELGTLRDP